VAIQTLAPFFTQVILLLKSETPLLYIVNDETINESRNGNYLELSSTYYPWIYARGWKKISLPTPVQNAPSPCTMGTGTLSPGLKLRWPSPHLLKTLRMSTAVHVLPRLGLHNMLRGDINFTFILPLLLPWPLSSSLPTPLLYSWYCLQKL